MNTEHETTVKRHKWHFVKNYWKSRRKLNRASDKVCKKIKITSWAYLFTKTTEKKNSFGDLSDHLGTRMQTDSFLANHQTTRKFHVNLKPCLCRDVTSYHRMGRQELPKMWLGVRFVATLLIWICVEPEDWISLIRILRNFHQTVVNLN